MRFVVDVLPEQQRDCPFSKWHPYPPIIEEPGYYECKLWDDRDNICDLDREKGMCMCLVESRREGSRDA